MVDYKQILRLRAEGVSQRGIADVLGCSRNTVAGVFTAATAAGVGFGEVADLAADEVRRLLLGEPARPDSDRVTPDFEHVHRELGRPSVTLLLVWNEYVAACRESGGVAYRYLFFNEQYRRWVASTGASMHIQRTPGESIEVDWAGDAMSFADPLSGAPTDAWLFVAALSFSAHAYVEAFTDMTLRSTVRKRNIPTPSQRVSAIWGRGRCPMICRARSFARSFVSAASFLLCFQRSCARWVIAHTRRATLPSRAPQYASERCIPSWPSPVLLVG